MLFRHFVRPPPGYARSIIAVVRALANTSVATARWEVTATGSVRVLTVIIPRMIWPRSRMNVNVENATTLLGQGYLLQANNIVETTRIVTTIVHTLCVSSMITLGVRAGITWPWHSGQSGQASPEPVEDTTPPRTIRT